MIKEVYYFTWNNYLQDIKNVDNKLSRTDTVFVCKMKTEKNLNFDQDSRDKQKE